MSENLSNWLGRESELSNTLLFKQITDYLTQNGTTPNAAEISRLSRQYKIPEGQILSILSAYDFLKNDSSSEHICIGTSCLIAGQKSLNNSNKVYCLGRCYENKSVLTNKTTVVSGDQQKTKSKIPVSADFSLLTAEDPSFDQMNHLVNKTTIDQLLSETQKAKLRGRGGAGFSFYQKLKTFSYTKDEIKYVICNADEGDPGAFSDKYLLEEHLNKVLFGMLICGQLSNAKKGIIYLRFEYPDTYELIQNKIQHYNSFFSFKIEVVRGAGSYVCGEETALINSLEGQRPEVRIRPPYPAQAGLFMRPTLLSNVETFACLYTIINHGGDYFAKIGTEKSTGTKLLCLDGRFSKPGVHEVKMGTSLLSFLSDKISKIDLKAIQVGGPLGSIVPRSKWKDLTIDFESFAENGFILGHGGIIGIPSDFSMLDLLIHLFEFTKDESCGKCYPCRIGSEKVYELLKNPTTRSKLSKEMFNDVLLALEKTSLCGLGGGLPLPVRNIFQYFPEELKVGGLHV